MISKSAENTAQYRALLSKENRTITIAQIVQRITHAFDYAFGCAFHKSNVCWSHSNANANVFMEALECAFKCSIFKCS